MKEKLYLIAYDICHDKRLAKVRKVAYSFALGGQKSALVAPLDEKALKKLILKLTPLIKKNDKVNIIEIDEDAMLFGRAKILEYDDGVVIL